MLLHWAGVVVKHNSTASRDKVLGPTFSSTNNQHFETEVVAKYVSTDPYEYVYLVPRYARVSVLFLFV